jgi:hypothetical protein
MSCAPVSRQCVVRVQANLKRLQAAQDRVWDQHRVLPAPEAEPQAAPVSSAPLCKVLGVLNWDRGGEWLRLLLGTCSLDWLSHADEQGLATQPSPHAVTLTTSACSPEAEAPKLSSVLLRRCVKGGKLLVYNPGPALQLLLHYGSAPEVQTRFTTDDRKVSGRHNRKHASWHMLGGGKARGPLRTTPRPLCQEQSPIMPTDKPVSQHLLPRR